MSRGAGTHGCTKGGGRGSRKRERGSIKGSSPRAEMRRAGCGEKRRERTGGRRTRACPADRLVTGRAQTRRGAEKNPRRQLPAGQARRIGLRPDAAARRTGTARKCGVITGRVSAGQARAGKTMDFAGRRGQNRGADRGKPAAKTPRRTFRARTRAAGAPHAENGGGLLPGEKKLCTIFSEFT